MIYSGSRLFSADLTRKGSLKHDWIDIRTLKEENVSPFLWTIIQAGKP